VNPQITKHLSAIGSKGGKAGKAPTQRAAFEWIAENDEPGSSLACDVATVEGYATVQFAAALFNKTPLYIARRVVARRMGIATKGGAK